MAAQHSFLASFWHRRPYDDAQSISSRVKMTTFGADIAGLIVLIFEPHADTVLAAPYNTAWKPQPVFRDDQREFIGNAEKVGKLQRGAGAGYVANNAWILVAAIVHLGGLHNFDAWRNPGFNHRNIPIRNTSRVPWLC